MRYSSPPIQQQQQHQQQQAHSPYDASGYPAAASFGSAMDGGANSPYGYGGQGAPNNGFYNGGARGGPGGQGQGMPGPFGNFLSNDPNVNMTAQMGMHMASVGGEYVQKNVSMSAAIDDPAYSQPDLASLSRSSAATCLR